jgi:hypothetical protein
MLSWGFLASPWMLETLGVVKVSEKAPEHK